YCWHISMMRKLFVFILLATGVATSALAQEARVYKWVDKDGVTHYGDSIPAEYAELPKEVINEHGVTVDNLAGKKSAEQIEAERVEKQRLAAVELQRRADRALLATYLSVEEIVMHRDRRVELFQAQARVTELYLRNLQRRMQALREEASNFQPYSESPDAPMIDESLAADLRKTKAVMARHERNLEKFRTDEQQIIARFDGDISRFKMLKGIE
ncbi:MAG: DUF4124 domain-containing protein, partial [Gammaproteobacteria bacterium]|nr:DUF4124 domain-containing protein [Gammaproteobacteria bacterium]